MQATPPGTATTTAVSNDAAASADAVGDIQYIAYTSELQLPPIMRLIEKDLSEPYTVYTYRYFLHSWPDLCFTAMAGETCIGVVICKMDRHRDVMRGYIAMLAVANEYRKRGIGSTLVKMAVRTMRDQGADEIALETEISNKGAQALYEHLGFLRHKRMSKYYLNGADAFRLKLWLK
ncbi:N-alpha-acetyltransferase 30 [Dinochytrium kinnereticum]|nr:N-alpha-acetyltransferase 30 [Dinochytrium kinnereticum]